MNRFLWVLQALLAVVFFAHGLFLLFPPAEMLEMLNATMSPAFRLFLGVAEVLAAIGLIVPGLTRTLPWLVSAAAAGLMVIMIGAIILHVTRGEGGAAMTTAFLFVALTFVAYARWKVKPILPRTVA